MKERHTMTDPIVLPVSTSTDGLELVETLARRGLAATLLLEAAGWRVEIPTRADHRAVLLDAISLAFADLELAPCPRPEPGAGKIIRGPHPRRPSAASLRVA
jgi:hypothetical protein